MSRLSRFTLVAGAAALLSVSRRAALAQSPFTITGQTTTGTPTQATVSGSSVVDLVDHLIESQQDFSSFQNQAFNASLNYGAVPNAIQFQRNAAGTSATVTIPSTGFTRTFTGTSEADVRKKIEDFLVKEGAHEYAKFLKPSELANHARAAGLEMRDLTGMTYNPITKVYALGRDVDVNYILATRRG